MAGRKKKDYLFCSPQLARLTAMNVTSTRQRPALPRYPGPKQLKPTRSKGRGGRKVGKAGELVRQERQRRLNKGDISAYDFTLARREDIQDPYRTDDMALGERELWDELHRYHLERAPALGEHGVAHRMAVHEANLAYDLVLTTRGLHLQDIMLESLRDLSLSEGARMLTFHSHRRLLGIYHQEGEMLRLNDAQARAVGEDKAFIAMGRSLKQRAFSALYGWWNPRELLYARGLLDEEDTIFGNPEYLLQEAVSAAQARDAQTAALFDSDQEDDDDDDLHGYAML
ncbi:hypothetical protein PENSPDRAFT_694526 [Peniophora sp. CONT]|nr:hypothetical protein PENSPDRAFT_694526 [Peniophora sp. CONT]